MQEFNTLPCQHGETSTERESEKVRKRAENERNSSRTEKCLRRGTPPWQKSPAALQLFDLEQVDRQRTGEQRLEPGIGYVSVSKH